MIFYRANKLTIQLSATVLRILTTLSSSTGYRSKVLVYVSDEPISTIYTFSSYVDISISSVSTYQIKGQCQKIN